jgi:hypothetical protein
MGKTFPALCTEVTIDAILEYRVILIHFLDQGAKVKANISDMIKSRLRCTAGCKH